MMLSTGVRRQATNFGHGVSCLPLALPEPTLERLRLQCDLFARSNSNRLIS